MATSTKKKWGCAGLAFLVGGYLLVFQLPYLVDPGLRDLPIRKKIRTLTAAECAEIVEGCEKIYRAHGDSFPDDESVRTDKIPAPAARVGYHTAVIQKDGVKLGAGAGAFSQVGPIMIICWMDPETKTAVDLALDDGRHFNPATGEFDTR